MQRIATHCDGWLPVVGPAGSRRRPAPATGFVSSPPSAAEVIIDLSLQPWFSTTGRMLEVAQEIHEPVREAQI